MKTVFSSTLMGTNYLLEQVRYLFLIKPLRLVQALGIMLPPVGLEQRFDYLKTVFKSGLMQRIRQIGLVLALQELVQIQQTDKQ